jgi:hypothetical protein
MNRKAKFAYVYMIGGLVVFLISILVLISDKLSKLKNSDSENPQNFLKNVNITSLLVEEIKLKFIDSIAHYNEIDEDVYFYWFCDLRHQLTSSLLSSSFYTNHVDNSKKSFRIHVARASLMKSVLGFLLCSIDTLCSLFLSVFVVFGFFILLYGCVRFYKYDIKMLQTHQRASLVSIEKSNENEQIDKMDIIAKLENSHQVNTTVKVDIKRRTLFEEILDMIRRIRGNTQPNSTKPNENNIHSEMNQQEISSQDYIELFTSNKENQRVQSPNISSTYMAENESNQAKKSSNFDEHRIKRKNKTKQINRESGKEFPFIYEELPVFMVKNCFLNSKKNEANSLRFASNLCLANELDNKSEPIRRSFGKVSNHPIENRMINKDDMVLISSSHLHSNPNLCSNSRYISLTNPNLHVYENFPTNKINWSTFGLNQSNSRFHNLPNDELIYTKRVGKVRNKKYSRSFKNKNKKNVSDSKKVTLTDSFLLNNLILENELNDAKSLDRIYSLRLKALNVK